MEMAPAGPLLRLGTSTDTEAIIALSLSTGVFTADELASLRHDLGSVYAHEGGHERLVVCEDVAGPLGFVQYSYAAITHGAWFIYWIAVSKRAQGQGIGVKLVRYAEDEVRRAGGRLLLIETSSKLPYEPTRRFYTGRGYELVARIPDYYSDGDDKCIFSKRL